MRRVCRNGEHQSADFESPYLSAETRTAATAARNVRVATTRVMTPSSSETASRTGFLGSLRCPSVSRNPSFPPFLRPVRRPQVVERTRSVGPDATARNVAVNRTRLPLRASGSILYIGDGPRPPLPFLRPAEGRHIVGSVGLDRNGGQQPGHWRVARPTLLRHGPEVGGLSNTYGSRTRYAAPSAGSRTFPSRAA